MTDITQQFQALGKAIQFAQQSHNVTGQNLANVNTPDYKTREVSFQQLLESIESHSPKLTVYEIKETPGLEERPNGNNVDMEREFGLIKKNSLVYQTLSQLLGAKMGIMQRSISG